MIALASDCLILQTTTGEQVPYSADMIVVDLGGELNSPFDPEFLRQAANAVFFYFKNDLGRLTVSVAEFAEAFEKVLRGFGPLAKPAEPDADFDCSDSESDLHRLAAESGKGGELFFYPRLRDELRQQLRRTPAMLRFRGLRQCVKELAGARRWTGRCQTLQEQIVEFLRQCVTAEEAKRDTALVVRD